MRRVFGIGSGLLMIFALLIAGARQIGHRQETGKFPLPAADGAWQGLRFYDMNAEAISDALRQHPDVDDLTETGPPDYIYYFTLPRRHAEPLPIRLWASPDAYVLAHNALVPNCLPLMRVGDLIFALGPPDLVYLSGNGEISLHYAARNLEVMVAAARVSRYGKVLRPGDSVRVLLISNPMYGYNFWDYNGFATILWRGFSLYIFEPDRKE